MTSLEFSTPSGERILASFRNVILAGYAGRNRSDVDTHVAEMRALGVEVPDVLPAFYPVLSCLLTQSNVIDVVGAETQPEVEFVIFASGGRRFVTVANDQFDLVVERQGWPTRSKNLCQKVIGTVAWPISEIASHWDTLTLELWSGSELLQRDRLERLLEPSTLVELASISRSLDEGRSLLFSGTIPFLRGLPPAEFQQFRMKLCDPVLHREISSDFSVRNISQVGGS